MSRNCYIGPGISSEQFISEHLFFYLSKGTISGYYGSKHYTLRAGEYGIVRKNQLGRYNKQHDSESPEKVIISFDEAFLKRFQERYQTAAVEFKSAEPFLQL